MRIFFFSSRRRHTIFDCDWIQTCALPISLRALLEIRNFLALYGPVSPDPYVRFFSSSGQSSDRKSTRLNSSHSQISYAVFCLKKKKNQPVMIPTIYKYYYPHSNSVRLHTL